MTRSSGIVIAILALLAAMFCFQGGASLAKSLFPLVGAEGTAALRVGLSALILIVVGRPWRARINARNWRPLVAYGASLGTMNLLFYMALRTVPLGIAVALEFSGPLAVTLLASRRALDFLWIALAVAGLAFLLPLTHAAPALDLRGVALALGAGACWGLYIVFGQKAGANHGGSTTMLGSAVAALIVVPFGIAHAGAALLQPRIWPYALMVAALSSALPYSLEMVALRRLPTRVFGTLMSLEPAVAALMGFLLLRESLAVIQWLAIGAVMLASAGMTLTAREPASSALI
jgi:inner membrane transporter RhtA